ncbi:hypothetical protein J1N35_038480 [Gossypium stocksii]|uniref:Vps16 N-terminal domain-containing protein n=1 Tax=Gossypium stocksii TaxID=47602 RepID=A0A9D3UM22_9ROSI|nr:hypothetical protein J1N35_038480 [Gossypium stocksii]
MMLDNLRAAMLNTGILCSVISIPRLADENLRLIHSSLPEAVEACIDAAGHEFDVSLQRTLLRAASYGQAFCRWGNTPLDEARMCGHKNLIKLLEDAKPTRLSELPHCSKEFTESWQNREYIYYRRYFTTSGFLELKL